MHSLILQRDVLEEVTIMQGLGVKREFHYMGLSLKSPIRSSWTHHRIPWWEPLAASENL
jgi:hypothetical protein